MHLSWIELRDFRNHRHTRVDPVPEGLVVAVGPNGEGKTNLLEAIGYLATLGSFRGAPAEALVRVGAGMAVIRAEGDRLAARIEAQEFPFDGTWCDLRRPPVTVPLERPLGWDGPRAV